MKNGLTAVRPTLIIAHPTLPMNSKLLLVRHGQTDWNLKQRLQGHTDRPLNGVGRRQALAAAERLRDADVDIIVSSDLARAHETAIVIAEQLGLDIEVDARLREYGFGHWEGLTWNAIAEQYPAEAEAWRSDRRHAPPGGESLADVNRRLTALLAELVQRQGTILLVGHGGSLRSIGCILLGLPIEHHWRLRMDNVAISSFLLHERGSILERWNDHSHAGRQAVPSATMRAHHSS